MLRNLDLLRSRIRNFDLGRTSRPPCRATRRDLLISVPLATFGSNLIEQQPQIGNCPTCIGVVDGTLGSCSTELSCLSSYDDRPNNFIAPWIYEARSADAAMSSLVSAVEEAGASRMERGEGGRYLYAVFPPEDAGPLMSFLPGRATDDVEFLIPDDNDTRVEIRSASRLPDVSDGGRQARRLREIRARLGWEEIPVLRNRGRAFGVIESPWDSFGPTPNIQSLGGRMLSPEDAEYGTME